MKNSHNNFFLKRLAIDVALLVALFVLPWWIFALISIVLLFFIPTFYEIIFLGIFIDSIYGGNVLSLSGHYFTIGSVAIFVIFHWLSKKLLFFER